MGFLWLTLVLGLTADEVLDKPLFTVRGDGRSCGALSTDDKALFRGWRLDDKRTAETRGIFGLFNPAATEQLVLFFISEELCNETLGILQSQKLVERDPLTAGDAEEPDPPPTVNGNPRGIDAAAASDELERLGAFAPSTLWCDCRLDGPAGRLACQDKEVSLAPVVPIRVFGPTFTEWSEGHPECTKRGQPFSGRRCAKQTSEEYRRMASDLYNLAPQLLRSSYLDRDLRAPLPEACEQDTRQGTLRPASTHRGSIARTYLYMAYTYPAHASLSPQMINVLERWNLEDPPSPQECGRGAAIAALQGNRNRFLEQGCGR